MQKKVDVVLMFNKAVLLDGNNTIDSFVQIWVNNLVEKLMHLLANPIMGILMITNHRYK